MSTTEQKFRESAARVLLATNERVEANTLVALFKENGFDVKWINNIFEVKRQIPLWKPQVIVADLLLGGGSGFDLLDYVNKANLQVSVIFISSHANAANVDEAFRRGAKDFVHRPFMHQQLLNRVILQCREPLEIKDPGTDNDSDTEVLLTKAMSAEKIDSVIHEIVRYSAVRLGGVRCSVIRTVTVNEGLVFASSDDPNIAGLRLDLSVYPEVQLVASAKKMIAINDLGSSRALKHILKKTKSVQFSAMIVAPVFYKTRFFGVVSMRLPAGAKITDREIRFMSVTAKVISLSLSTRPVEDLSQFGLISAS